MDLPFILKLLFISVSPGEGCKCWILANICLKRYWFGGKLEPAFEPQTSEKWITRTKIFSFWKEKLYIRIVVVRGLQTLVINLVGVGLRHREMIYWAGTPLEHCISMQAMLCMLFLDDETLTITSMLGKKNSCVGICGWMVHESALMWFWLLPSSSTQLLLLLCWRSMGRSSQEPCASFLWLPSESVVLVFC